MPRLPFMRIFLRLVLAALAALAIGACGGGSSGSDDGDNSALKYRGAERAAAQTIEDFATAIRGDDWKRICNDLFSEDERKLTAGIISESCEKEIDSYANLDNLRLTVTYVKLENSAEVDTTTAAGRDASFTLKQEGGAWRIDGMSGDFTAGGEPSGETATGAGDERAVRQVVLDFDQALAGRDWAKLCGLLTESGRSFVGTDCEADAGDEYGDGALGLSITAVAVKHEATVGARTGKGGGASFTLVPDGDRWRIDSYGGTFGNG
jgi:hypothetical protein